MPSHEMFDGTREDAEKFIKRSCERFYVYVLCRPDGRPFYVGKGQRRRVFEHEAEARRTHPLGETNPFKCNVIRKIIREGGSVRYKIDSIYDVADELRCLEREAALIAKHKRLHEGGWLTNLAGGIGNLSGAAPFSLERHAATLSGTPADNPERAILNRYLLSIGAVGSVPVKPLSQLKPILPTTPHPAPRTPKARNAFALIASAAAHGIIIVGDSLIPRCFTYDGVEAIIENGVARDIIKAGVASLIPANNPKDEIFAIDTRQAQLVVQLAGRNQLEATGLI